MGGLAPAGSWLSFPAACVGPPHLPVAVVARQGPLHCIPLLCRPEPADDVVLGHSLDRWGFCISPCPLPRWMTDRQRRAGSGCWDRVRTFRAFFDEESLRYGRVCRREEAVTTVILLGLPPRVSSRSSRPPSRRTARAFPLRSVNSVGNFDSTSSSSSLFNVTPVAVQTQKTKPKQPRGGQLPSPIKSKCLSLVASYGTRQTDICSIRRLTSSSSQDSACTTTTTAISPSPTRPLHDQQYQCVPSCDSSPADASRSRQTPPPTTPEQPTPPGLHSASSNPAASPLLPPQRPGPHARR